MPVFHFQVDWGGTNVGFSEVMGLAIETQLIEYRDGASREYSSLKISGIPKYSNITLKRGIIAKDSQFFQWLNGTSLNKPERRNVVIKLLNEAHEPVMAWSASAGNACQSRG